MKQKIIANKRQTGAVAVTVALSLVVLIGFVGLALDVGRLFITKSELQNSADACALAAARELTGVSNTQLTIAKAAGMTIGTAHNVMFQSEAVNNISVTFGVDQYAQNNEAFEGETAKNMEYVRCTARRTGIATWLIQVLNILPGVDIGEQAVAASAVATLTNAQNNCAIPVGICEKDLEAVGGEGAVGEWLEGTLSDGMTGSFKWIDFSPPSGGASELADLLKGAGLCNVPSTGASVGESGFVASLADTWNTRFGIYKNKPTQAGSVPDFTGYAYTKVTDPSKFGVYDDFKNKRKANTPYQGNDEDIGLDVKGSVDGVAELKANGADRRLAAVPIVDCDNFVDGQTAEIKKWGCVLMLHPISDNASSEEPVRMYLEYLGLASNADSPCATLGVPGDSTSLGPQVPVLVK